MDAMITIKNTSWSVIFTTSGPMTSLRPYFHKAVKNRNSGMTFDPKQLGNIFLGATNKRADFIVSRCHWCLGEMGTPSSLVLLTLDLSCSS